MEKITLAETIKSISKNHLTKNNGLLLGECVTAVGWVNNTVPDCPGIIELPMSDVAGAGIAVGAAIVGRRPIFVIRFQDFLILNGSPLIYYAAKVKELHGKSAPVFIRAIAAEGLGPVHSGVLHSVYMHFPGFRVCSPMTPKEYQSIWEDYMNHDDPMFVSEHRLSYKNTEELPDIVTDNADITLYPISVARFEMNEVVEKLKKDGIKCNVVHILWLKPFAPTKRLVDPLKKSKSGLVIDSSFEISGASRSIAYELEEATGYRVRALGLEDHTKCLCPPLQNKTPDADKIIGKIKEILNAKKG